MSPKELMKFLNIKSPTTLIKYEREGLIEPYRPFGKKKYYLKSEIMKLFK
ncbi:helix-turn-helix domain-containing protein [Aquimarina algiphila]